MRQAFTAICLLALALSTKAGADDAGIAHGGDIVILDGWARASIGNAPNSAAYLTVTTKGDAADKLLSVSTPAAEAAELHHHVMDGDIARMQKVETIDVEPGAPLSMEPGGYHVMLFGLTGNLAAGEVLTITLTFEKAGEIAAEIPIRSLRDAMKQARGHNHGN